MYNIYIYIICHIQIFLRVERTSDQESLDLKALPTLVCDQSCIHVVSTNMVQAWERIADRMERGQGEAEILSQTEEIRGGECRDCVLS